MTYMSALQSSAFSDPDAADTHRGSQWQVTPTAGDYTTPLYDSGTDSTHLTTIVWLSLGDSTTYYWHVRYKDSHGVWSPWSNETHFTTTGALANRPPNQPSNVSPASGAIDVILTPTLTSTSFSDPDVGDTHAGSQWQITTTPGTYPGSVFDNTTDSYLTSITVPSGRLNHGSTYYWRVRYQDSDGAWSNWSAETSFSTSNDPAADLQADFAADKTEVLVNEPVQFTDNSTGGSPPLSYEWDFNRDGIWDSTLQYPSYGYSAPGTYTVVMRVTDSAANFDTEAKIGYITVSPSTSLAAPTLVSPANGATVPGTSVTYQWDPVLGAASYYLIVSTNSDPGSLAPRKFYADVGNVTSYTDSGYPDNGTKYYWWVWAVAPRESQYVL